MSLRRGPQRRRSYKQMPWVQGIRKPSSRQVQCLSHSRCSVNICWMNKKSAKFRHGVCAQLFLCIFTLVNLTSFPSLRFNFHFCEMGTPSAPQLTSLDHSNDAGKVALKLANTVQTQRHRYSPLSLQPPLGSAHCIHHQYLMHFSNYSGLIGSGGAVHRKCPWQH